MQKFVSVSLSYVENFFNKLKAIPPERAVVVTDMLNTLVSHTKEDERVYQGLIDFVSNGGRVVVVTGDGLDTISRIFINRLHDYFNKQLYQDKIAIQVLAVFGHQEYTATISPQPVKFELVHQSDPIPVQMRTELLNRMLDLMGTHFGKRPEIGLYKMVQLYSLDGGVVSLKDELGLAEEVFLEMRPGKVTVAFSEKSHYDPRKSEFLKAIYSDPEIQSIARENDLHIVEPDLVYTEITRFSKGQGLSRFWASPSGQAIQPENRVRIYMGDSKNDRELFNSDKWETGSVFKVYVGDDEDYFNREINPKKDPNTVILKGQYIQGAGNVLTALAQSPNREMAVA